MATELIIIALCVILAICLIAEVASFCGWGDL